MIKKTAARILLAHMLIQPALSQAAPTIPGFYGTIPAPVLNAVPQLKPGGTLSGATVSAVVNNTLTINQNQSRATIDWKSFDIGANATVYFKQQRDGVAQKDWAALNRIHDSNPSLIYGKLKADGKVYLINQNGILFGPGSRVNVHSLAASALNLRDKDFQEGVLRFNTDNYQSPEYLPLTLELYNQSAEHGEYHAAAAANRALAAPNPEAVVANYGEIVTGTGGSVFLLGPRVENGGGIVAPSGKIDLIGALRGGGEASQTIADLEVSEAIDFSSAHNDVTYWQGTAPGETVNQDTGTLRADSGQINLYGRQVWQNGLIRAISAVKQNGQIYLAATERVSTGALSLTDVSPDDSREKVSQTFPYAGGEVRMIGVDVEEGSGKVRKPLQNIEHHGAIKANSGAVALNAVQRVYLETGSSIDVSGVWVDQDASANLLQAQLNSVQLADAQNQKWGVASGEGISTTMQNGAGFGDISGSYLIGEQTTRERSTRGGTITIGLLPGPGTLSPLALQEFIAKEGSTLDFSGGGFNYAAGNVATTKLLNGNRLYDISEAPEGLSYQGLVGHQSVVDRKFGTSREYRGLYFGGGTGMSDYAPARTVASDAGSMVLAARQVVLNGRLDGSVTPGDRFQINVTPRTSDDHRDYDISIARGLEAPVGGTLLIGNDPGAPPIPSALDLTVDSVVEGIVVQETVAPLAGFGADTPLTGSDVDGNRVSELSARILSDAGLSRLGLFTNGSLTIEEGARLTLMPGGSYSDPIGQRFFTSQFSATGRRIEHRGELLVPGGSASFTLKDNITSLATNPLTEQPNPHYRPLEAALQLAPGSVVSARGVGIDNSGSENEVLPVVRGVTSGGQIVIQDLTLDGTLTGNTLTVAQGALLDVSGGYLVDRGGKISGGDAGTLTLKAMDIDLDGELRGLALAGKKGGSINLHAGAIVVAADPAPEELPGTLVLDDERLSGTGFTRIALSGINDVTFAAGSELALSRERLAPPAPAAAGTADNGVLPVDLDSPDYLGATSITAGAGANIYVGELPGSGGTNNPTNPSARLTVEQGAVVASAAGGAITLKGPAVDLGGTLSSPGGTIKVSATGSEVGVATDLTLISGAVIDAAGYLKADGTMVAGRPAGPVPQAGGAVSLVSEKGGVILESGSRVDVSGSAPSERLTKDAAGAPVALTTAGAAGSLALSFDRELVLDGTIAGAARQAGVQGGTLAVTKTLKSPLNDGSFSVSGADLARYQAAGFDALTLKSATSLTLEGGIDADLGRSLTLDARSITGSGSGDVILRAPWLRLVNGSGLAPLEPVAGTEAASLTLKGEWIDLEGATSVSHYSDLILSATRDLRLSDSYQAWWAGSLASAGNLTLQGARIYPTTEASFSITSQGKVTILPSSVSDATPVYSAGGSLSISAARGIEHRGVLAAPMGSINLAATGSGQEGRVYLAEGSSTSTTGSAPVLYGSFDGTTWTGRGTDGAAGGGDPVLVAPEKSITLGGDQVVIKDGAQLELSGGGSVFTYLYQTGVEGTANPITVVGISQLTNQKIRPDRYVIMPDNSVQLPGFSYSYTDTDGTEKSRLVGALHLEGVRLADGSYLREGTYSLLPEQFAFLPGALVLTDLGSTVAPGSRQVTGEGYQVVAGYQTFLGTGIESQLMRGYAVRPAAEVLRGGNFTVKGNVGALSGGSEFSAGDAGTLNVAGKTTVMAGSFSAAPLPGYRQGALKLGGTAIEVQESVSGLADIESFDTPIPDEMMNKLQLAASALSGEEMGNLQLGDENTLQVTIRQGSVVNAPSITLAARDRVTVESGAELNAVAEEEGEITLSAPAGSLDIQANARIHASGAVNLDVNDINLQGELVSDSSTLNLSAQRIAFVPDSFVKGSGDVGLFLTEELWSDFATYQNLGLTSRSDLSFRRDVTLTLGDTLTLDAQRISGPAEVVLNAQRITLKNSGSAGSPGGAPAGGSLSLKADQITVTQSGASAGEVVFDGFADVTLTSRNDLTLQGRGSLKSSGDLNLTAARITTSSYRDDATPYQNAGFLIDAGAGGVSIGKGEGSAGGAAVPGGSLAIRGGSVTLEESALIEVASGEVALSAGSGDVTMLEGAQILARGSRLESADDQSQLYLPGGRIALSSANGKVDLRAGSRLDVSSLYQGAPAAAPAHWDAGTIELSAPKQGVTLAGTLAGQASHGQGGSFTLDSKNLQGVGGVDGLAQRLRSGGFDNRIALRSRAGNLTLSEVRDGNGQQIAALKGRDIEIAADGGSLSIGGWIDADGAEAGGRVELYAGGALALLEGALISARGTGAGAAGGAVLMSSRDGAEGDQVFNGSYALRVDDQARIDVSGTAPDAAGAPRGGSVAFRAFQGKKQTGDPDLNDLNMAPLAQGSVVGAERVSVEAARSYLVEPATPAGDGTPANANIGTAGGYLTDAAQFMSAAAGAGNRLFGAAAGAENHLQAGIELNSAPGVELTLDSNWDLSPATANARPGGEPGVITLRAGGNLNLNANLVDHPTTLATLHSSSVQPSWGINLVAGADPGGARLHAVSAGQGNLTLGQGKLVYSENAPIRFASGGNTEIGSGYYANGFGPRYMINPTLRYNIGSYGGAVRGETGGDLTIGGGAIQTAVGAIELRVGGDLNLVNSEDFDSATFSIGSIRTTGEYTPGQVRLRPGDDEEARAAKATDYWTYQGGGSITLDVAGRVAGKVNRIFDGSNGRSNAWDLAYYGTNSGSKSIDSDQPSYLTASYDGTDATEGIAAMAGGDVTVRAGHGFTSQIGVFGAGDLRIFSGGDLDGRFRLGTGVGQLTATGSFGAADDRQVLEIGAAQVERSDLTVAALGDLMVGGVVNPFNTRSGAADWATWNLTYSPESSVSLISVAGSVTLAGTPFDGVSNQYYEGYEDDNLIQRQRILPPVVTVVAGEDLVLLENFAMTPSPTGNLRLVAGNDISGRYATEGRLDSRSLAMVDVPIDTIYGWNKFEEAADVPVAKLFGVIPNNQTVLHRGDSRKVEVTSKGGDVDYLKLYLSKPADISAGGNIQQLTYHGQNLAPGDITSIRAQGDIYYSFVPSPDPALGIVQGGGGTLLVQAGGNIDLGNAPMGIQSVGNRYTTSLEEKGSDLIVVVGAKGELSASQARGFFLNSALFNESGSGYSALLEEAAELMDPSTKASPGAWSALAAQLLQETPQILERADQGEIGLKMAGNAYTTLKSLAQRTELGAEERNRLGAYAQDFIERSREGLIARHFDAPTEGKGSLTMVNSQIGTMSGKADIYLLAQGDLNVGRSVISYKQPGGGTGIYTNGGGAINVYSGRDANVNESRLMTLLGGDIVAWSDTGDVNAGRGSQTAVSPPRFEELLDEQGRVIGSKIIPPAIGSGIRAVTYDPNRTPGGALPIPEPGNIYLFAPQGIIDAGEAGIAGGRVVLGATALANAKNVSSSFGSVGVGSGSAGSVSLGSLAGAGSVAENSKMIEQVSGLSSAKEKGAAQSAKVDDFMSKWLDVKIISFETEPERQEDEQKEEKEKQKKR